MEVRLLPTFTTTLAPNGEGERNVGADLNNDNNQLPVAGRRSIVVGLGVHSFGREQLGILDKRCSRNQFELCVTELGVMIIGVCICIVET